MFLQKNKGYFLKSLPLLFLLFFMQESQAHGDFFHGLSQEGKKEFELFLSTPFDKKRFSHTAQHRGKEIVYHLEVPDDMDLRPPVGYVHKRSTLIHHAARTQDTILFKANYHYNDWGRRVLQLDHPNATKHFILGGGSFALGIGLEDKDTILYHLLKDSQDYHPLNIAVAGSGTNTMLAITQNDLKREVQFQEGVFVYLYNDFHIDRSNGFAMQRQWLADSPWFEKEENKGLVNKGTFKVARPYSTWVYNAIVKTFSFLGLKYNFPRRNADHILYTCDLIKETSKAYLKNFIRGKFLVYPHPFSPMNPKMKECLSLAKIEILSPSFQWDPKIHEIPFERHPNGLASELVAKDLKKILE